VLKAFDNFGGVKTCAFFVKAVKLVDPVEQLAVLAVFDDKVCQTTCGRCNMNIMKNKTGWGVKALQMRQEH
jgi:hypothetical protein